MFADQLPKLWKDAAVEMIDTNSCMACPEPSVAHMLVTRFDGTMTELLVCKDHMLDPGPLLDY